VQTIYYASAISTGVRFCYCPECKKIRPRNWHSRRRCEVCDKECITFTVDRSIYGWLMYALDAVAFVLILLYALHYQFSVSWASFFGAFPADLAVILIFGLILVSFVFASMDLSKTIKAAEERVRSGKIVVTAPQSKAPDQ